jgi:crotonobetainyl-CoA:carnitine CoA-transferase CaiB-like acyl-CoA transferase
VLANQGLNYLISGKLPERIGNAHPNIVPYQVFSVADGHVIIASGNDGQFAKLCTVLGEPALAQQAEYKTNADRVMNRGKLIAHLTTLTMKLTRAQLLAGLEGVNVPAGPIYDLNDVFGDPQVIHRGMKLNVQSAAAKAGAIPGIRTPIVIGGEPMASSQPSPRLGEHTQEILHEIGEA